MTDEQTMNAMADVLYRYLGYFKGELRRAVAAEIAAQLLPIVKSSVANELDRWVYYFDTEYTEVILGGADFVCSVLAQAAVDIRPTTTEENA